MKRHTLAALISSLFVLSSAYGYAASVGAASPESPSASPATTPATLSAAELAAFAKALPQIAPYIQTQAEQSAKTSLAAAEYFQTQVQEVIKEAEKTENFRKGMMDIVNDPIIRGIMEPMSEYKTQVDGVKAVENYAGYMSSVYQATASQAAIAALQAAAAANQQDIVSNTALYNTLTANQARARQVYDTLHAYTSTHVDNYTLGKIAQQIIIDTPKIDEQLKRFMSMTFQSDYQENVVGLLASLQQASASVERIQQAQQFATMLTDNKVTDKLNGAALVAAVQENIQGIENSQQALAQLQQARQADLMTAHVIAIGAADAVKKANEASIAAASATLNQSLQDNQRAEQQARQASLTAAHVIAIGAADAVKKANDTAISEAKKTLRQDQENTLAVNLMALGELKRVQDNTNTSSSDAFNAALNDSKRELSAAIQANSHSLSRRIDENRKKAAAGIAGVAAMSNIPIPYAEGSFTVGVGVGYYDSQSAGAIGIGKGFENGLAIKASASFATDSNVAIGGGASWSF
ncbi:YadA-like C-terminal region [Edwardsiella tarda]|nr:YadA-like C-terminal region [Edwardsiella tarda]